MAGETLGLQAWHFFLRFPFFIYSEGTRIGTAQHVFESFLW